MVARKRDTNQVSHDKLAAILTRFWRNEESVRMLIRMGSLRNIIGCNFETDPSAPCAWRLKHEKSSYPLTVPDETELEA